MRQCKICGVEKQLENFPVHAGYRAHKCVECYRKLSRERTAANYEKHRDKRLETMRTRYSNHKQKVLSYYGDRCLCCGESEPLFLTIDHIENDGAAHRKRAGFTSHHNIYGWLVRNKFPSGFQVLCMNCNQGKHRNGGVCPHVKKVQRSSLRGVEASASKRAESVTRL
jgi:hypothetical protein